METIIRSARLILPSLVLAAAVASADTPDVRFDTPPSVACRQFAMDEHAALGSGTRLIEAVFQVSALLAHGDGNQCQQLAIQIDNPEHTMRVLEFDPKTSLATDTVGHLNVNRSLQERDSLNLQLSGNLNSMITGNAGGSTGKDQSESMSYQKLPPLETVLAAGTIQRGFGVFFKLRNSTQTTLEGMHSFRIVWEVPVGWRADFVRVVCHAQGMDKSGREHSVGTGSFLVALYQAGDNAAREAADSLGHAEQNLLRIALAKRGEIEKRGAPTLAHELSLTKPRIPDDWLYQITRQTARQDVVSFHFFRYLPPDVQSAAYQYRRAKYQLVRLATNAGSDNDLTIAGK